MAIDWDDPDEAFEELHWGEEPDQDLQVDDERFDGEVLTLLGELTELTYTTTKGGEPLTDFVHEFAEPFPLLCIDHRGKLAIVGGGYVVGSLGIED